MKLSDDQQRLRGLLQETITLLCKNGLNYDTEFSVEALIVITLDQDKIFHTNIKETVAKDGVNLSVTVEGAEIDSPRSSGTRTPKVAKKRKVQHDCSPEIPSKKSASRTEETALPEAQSLRVEESGDEEEEDGSEIVLIKDEGSFNKDLRNSSEISGGVVPVADLQYVHSTPVVDQDGQVIQQQEAGWADGDQSGAAANISSADASQFEQLRMEPSSHISSGRKHYSRYDSEDMKKAFDAVKSGTMSLRKAAKLYNIPPTTLSDRVHGRVRVDAKSGPGPIFTEEEEREIKDHILDEAENGSAMTRAEILSIASEFAFVNGKRTRNQPLGIKWFSGFVKRWPELSSIQLKKLAKQEKAELESVTFEDTDEGFL